MGSEGASGVTVHITGFKKFHGVSENPTETIVSNLKEFMQKNGSPHGLILGSFNVLDTAGVGALAKLYKILESAVVGRDGGSSNNVIWLHLGVNSGVTRFAIENQAVNEATFRCPDELGWKPNKAPIVPSDGLITRTRESSLPVNEISNALAKKGYAVSPSDDAGRFVCNYVYYHSLRFAEQHGIKSLFVHVPLFTTINEETQMQFVASLLEAEAMDVVELRLENYAKTEEAKVEELIKAVAESGANVVVSGAAVGDMALYFCERYKLMVLKVSSKFELRRLCRTTGAVALLKLSQPNSDELGFANSVSVEEISGSRITVVKSEEGGNSVSTVVLRGSTDSILDDLERAVDDGVNTYKAMCRDSRIVPGAAATEIELARKLKEFSFKETGLDQYAIAKFAESFELVPRTLSENAGLNAMEIISSLYAEHAAGNTKVGIDLDEGACKDASVMNIWDLHVTKFFALKYASDAACTVLRVDQIIMARPAGGPNPRANQPMDED